MCLSVYVGSDVALPVKEWNKENPSFYAEKAKEDYGIKKQFSKPNIYYVGSHEGCGCGFLNDEYAESKDIEYEENRKLREESINEFLRYLKDALTKTKDLELFVCWEGEQGEKPKEKSTIIPDNILETNWGMDTRALYRIVSVL